MFKSNYTREGSKCKWKEAGRIEKHNFKMSSLKLITSFGREVMVFYLFQNFIAKSTPLKSAGPKQNGINETMHLCWALNHLLKHENSIC